MDHQVAALIALVGNDDKARRQEVADALGCSEQTLYQIVRQIPLKSGRPRGVGRDLRERLDLHYPGWLDGHTSTSSSGRDADSGGFYASPAPTLSAALPVVLNAIAAASDRAKLRTALNALIDDDAPAYRQRVTELLAAPSEKQPRAA